MPAGLALLDTSVLVLLLTTPQPGEDPDTDRRRQAALDFLSRHAQRYRWAVPAPVVAELGRHAPARAALLEVQRHLARLRVLPLDLRAAEVAARMAESALKARAAGAERGAVKYDTLIAAIAHERGAEAIVTENPRDFDKCLAVVRSAVEVIVPSRPAATGQANLWQLPRRQGP